jgi:hypothetical protein
MSAHARLSPSARHRWQKCPASIRASEQYDGEGCSSPAAIDGTHSHTLLEHCLKNNVPASHYLGAKMADHDGEFVVEADRMERVQVALDYIRDCIVNMGYDAKLYSEKTVDPFRLLGRTDMGGTVDVHVIAGRILEVIDYKDGMEPVPVINNPQMQQYVFGILAEHVTDDGTFPFNDVILTIIQPKLAMKGMPTINSWVVPIEEVANWYGPMVEEAAATDDPAAPFVPGEKQCKWCPHAANCSARIEHTFGKAGIEFGNMEFAREAAQKDVNALPDEQLCAIVEAAPMLRKMIEDAEAEAIKRIKGGHPVAGLKVVAGVGRRQWSQDEEVVAAKLAKMGVPKGSIWETKLVSPAGVEKLRWSKRDGTEKQLSAKQLALIQSEMVSKSEGKLTVVPMADRRPAIEFGNLGQMFGPADAQSMPDWLS